MKCFDFPLSGAHFSVIKQETETRNKDKWELAWHLQGIRIINVPAIHFSWGFKKYFFT